MAGLKKGRRWRWAAALGRKKTYAFEDKSAKRDSRRKPASSTTEETT